MRLSRTFRDVHFTVEVYQQAAQALFEDTDSRRFVSGLSTFDLGEGTWTFDNEDEFWSEYRRGVAEASVTVENKDAGPTHRMIVEASPASAIISVEAPTRAIILRTFGVFDSAAEACRVEPPPPTPAVQPTVFIGHGRDTAWRDLKDHLTDIHDYRVEAYEVGARAGHTIRDVLDDMLTGSTFALIVLTAEDEQAHEQFRARQNVVHELGLFQGRLGFGRAIALVENGTELMSNLDGIQQLRFEKGGIRSVFGDVLGTLRREFGDAR